MTDSAKEQVFILSPLLEELLKQTPVKRDGGLTAEIKSAIRAFEFQDVEPSIGILVKLLADKNADVVAICLRAFTDLFLSKNFDFFLSSNHAVAISRCLIHILETTKSKSPIYNDGAQCMTFFLMSPNQQLYIHEDELDYVLTSLLKILDAKTKVTSKKVIENILKRFLHNIVSMASRGVDEFVAADYRNMIRFLVQALSNDFAPETVILIIELIESTVFDAPKDLQNTSAHRKVLLVEIPQLFIQYSLTVSQMVFERIFELYKKFVGLGELVVTSFSLIIGEMITPAIDNETDQALRAITMLNVLNEKEPYLLMVFAICDCSSESSKRVFEDLIGALSKLAMDGVANPAIVIPCLEVLLSTASLCKKFLVKTNEEDESEGDVKAEREVLEQKMTAEGCAKRFNESPKKAIPSFVNSGLAENTPESLASFIKQCSLLDPVKVSEFLAGGTVNEILSAYINTFDFSGLTLDAALREMCATFRLPGESQQIDRVMQCFASKYHKDNPSGMSEDAAYVISFSIIMLHTDIYNPNVVHKIKCDEWITNTRHVKDACEVEIEVLKEIYDRVVSKPMKLNEGTISPTAEAEGLRYRSRKQLKKLMERTENQELPKITRELCLLVTDRSWSTFFAAFSICLQGVLDLQTIKLALECVEMLVFLLSTFSMSKELETVIQFLCSLCNVPGLQILALETMVRIVKADGDGLGSSWLPILELFSKVVRPILPPNRFAPIDSSTPKTALEVIEGAPIAEIEMIYEESMELDRFPFQAFVRTLCQVSTAEIFENPPSLYTLDKLIDVCLVNMNRVRFVWSLAWEIIGAHFCRIGCLPHEQICCFTIQGLDKVIRNLAKNPEKWQHFQHEVMSPLLVIFQNQGMLTCKKLIIERLGNFINSGSVTLDAAWGVVLDILAIAANDESKEIVSSTYRLLESILSGIPSKYNSKLVIVLLIYANQTRVSPIKGQAMAYVTSVGMKIEPVTTDLIRIISSIIADTEDVDVIAFSANMLFMLIPRLNSDWESLESEYILPLFAIANTNVLHVLINEFFTTLLPESGDKALPILPKLTSIFIELCDEECLKLLLNHICQISSTERYKTIATQMMEKMTTSKSSSISIISIAAESTSDFSVLDICLTKAIHFSAVHIVQSTFKKLLPFIDSPQYSSRIADLVLAVLDFANTTTHSLPLIKLISDSLGTSNLGFMKAKRADFQKALFEFYLNENAEIRRAVKDLAVASQSLFL